MGTGYIDEGDPEYTCVHCGAIMWYNERLNRRKNSQSPSFTLCCGHGQVQLPLLKDPPTVLKRLIEGDDEHSKHFQRNLGPYNMVFSFTSLGGKVERCVGNGIGPEMFQLQGENYHLMGSLAPPDGNEAKFGQLYIVDTENEAENRANCLRYLSFQLHLYILVSFCFNSYDLLRIIHFCFYISSIMFRFFYKYR